MCGRHSNSVSEVRLFLNIKYGTFGNIHLSYLYVTYTKQNSTVFTCFLDAAKAFDRVSHWTLFSEMIKKNVPMVIVRVTVIAFWYQTQPMCIKWGKVNSDYFNVSNGVRQGGVLSPKLFAIYIYIYIDDLSNELYIYSIV